MIRRAPTPAELAAAFTLHIGTPGMGKTYALVKVAEAHERAGWRVIVVDSTSEWAQKSTRGVKVAGPKGAAAAEARGAKLLVWCGPNGDDPDVSAAASYAMSREGTLVCVTEAHRYWPLDTKLPSLWCRKLLTGHRHAGAALLLDTQSLASLSPMARKGAGRWRVFGMTDELDLEVLRKKGGPALVAASLECAARKARGQPGYHVVLDTFNPRPAGGYKLVRM